MPIRRVLRTTFTSRSERGVGKRIEHDVAQDAVDDGDGADAERERDRRREGEPGCPRQRADAVTDISPQILEPVDRPSHLVALERLDTHAMFTGHCPEVECHLYWVSSLP